MAAASAGSRSSAAANAATACSASRQQILGDDEIFLGARPRTGHGGELALRLARRALDGGEALARLGQHALRLAAELAQALLLGACGGQGLDRLALGIGRRRSGGARFGLFQLQRRQAVALGKPLRGRRGALGRGRISVPTPQVAGARDEALAGLQSGLQLVALLAPGNDAGLAQTAVELGRRFDVARQRFDAGRQRRILTRHLDVAPVHGGFLGGRRFEIVAERGAERRLVALLHAQAVEDGREIGVPRADQQLDQRLALGAQRCEPQPRLAAFLARRIGDGDDRARGFLGGERLHLEACAIWSASCWPASVICDSFSASGARPAISRACAPSSASWRLSLATLPCRSARLASKFCLRARCSATFVVSSASLASAARSASCALSSRARASRSLSPAFGFGGAERLDFGAEVGEDLPRLGDQRFLARRVAAELLGPRAQLALALGGARRLALEILLLDAQTAEDRGALAFLLAQRVHALGKARLFG